MASGTRDERRTDSPDGDSADGASEDPSAAETGPTGLACVEESVDEAHLADIPDGSGCAEVWEHLAERRGDGE